MAGVKQALDTLRELEDGKLLNDLSIEINELVRQVRQCNKAGSVSIVLKIEPVNGDTHNVTTKAQINVKAPQLERRATLFFTTPDCNLSRTDPSQRSLPGLESVDGGLTEVEDVDDGFEISEA